MSRSRKLVPSISLKLFLLAFTVVCVFFGLRCEQRSSCFEASQQIEGLGARVVLAWQKPQVVTYIQFVGGPQISDGRNLLKIEQLPVTCGRIEFVGLQDKPTGFSLWSFLFGDNEDIAASVISIPARLVDENTVSLIQQLDLKAIVLVGKADYFGISLSKRLTQIEREKWLKQQYEDSFLGISLIQDRLPNVPLYFQVEHDKIRNGPRSPG